MILRDFLHLTFCPDGRGGRDNHLREALTHYLRDDRMICEKRSGCQNCGYAYCPGICEESR